MMLYYYMSFSVFDKMDGGEERLKVKSSQGGGSSSSPMIIANRFAELMLVVGVDDNTELVPLGGHGLEVIIIYLKVHFSCLTVSDKNEFFLPDMIVVIDVVCCVHPHQTLVTLTD